MKTTLWVELPWYEEMEALVRDWLGIRHPVTCPHGRSICYRIDHKDIARKLDRH